MLFTKGLPNDYDVEIGNNNDCCFYCLLEKHAENKNKSFAECKKDLAGRLKYKKIYKNKKINFTICKDHINKIAELLNGKKEDDENENKK